MDEYAGRVLADRYRLPLPASDEFELRETRAWDTYSGQEVLVRQVPLPEVVEAEVLDADGLPDGFVARDGRRARPADTRSAATRRPTDPAVRRAIEAAQAAASIPDHPRLDQVFDVFAQGGSLWIVSELVPARSLESLLADKPLTPYRAAEVAADVLMALRVLHAHGWVHRNITERTVLVCDDGRVMLTGLAAGAAEEALCGYDPVPGRDASGAEPAGGAAGAPGAAGVHGPGGAKAIGGAAAGVDAPGRGSAGGAGGRGGYGQSPVPGAGGVAGGGPGLGAVGGSGGGGGYGESSVPAVSGPGAAGRQGSPGGSGYSGRGGGYGVAGGTFAGDAGGDPEAARRAAIEARSGGGAPGTGADGSDGGSAGGERRALETGGDIRAARAGAIAAYRAGARAAARVQEAEQSGRTALPGGARPSIEAPGTGGERGPATPPPGQIADPYGVRTAPTWNGGVAPATGLPGQPRNALPAGANGAATSGVADGVPSQQAWPLTQAQPQAQTQGVSREQGPSADGVARQQPWSLSQAHAQGVPQGSSRDQFVPVDGVPSQQTWPPTHAQAHAQGAPQDAPRDQAPPADRVPGRPPGWEGVAAPRRGPATPLAAERARQARMAVVGAVTERWAPEQAGPVHENWQLAPPIGPATDLWALGALLFRAVQGHAPYPEESTAELVQLVCAEPPAFAEECGPLRPVVESLLRQDPTERLDFEELNGWLRSLVRSAPEPEAGVHTVAAPPTDPRRLPIVRRRGELVRRRRAGLPANSPHGRHKRARQEQRAPRRLGRNLLLVILLALAAAVAYAMFFMPKAGSDEGQDGERTGSAGEVNATPQQSADTPDASSEPRPEQTSPSGGNDNSASPSAGSSESESESETEPDGGPKVAAGFTLRTDAEGFRVAVANGWDRTAKNGRGQVVYSHGAFELIVVPGRDTTKAYGSDPMAYQREREYELQPFRDSTWATSSGMRTIEVGGRAMAEGQFTWQDSSGSEVFVRNLAIVVDGRYHVVQVRGPEAERDEVTRLYEQAADTYQFTG
ncbi:protein kinase [Streptomyces geranii]|uniref:protein kinase n=1 Tax=Streptomyces geranii TaxID=2058923 RepID=UPI000D0473AF|nr:protein kinase [Streptomyces geranii]